MQPSTTDNFEQLAKTWKRDTQFMSSAKRMSNHPAYREIISMGVNVLPLIFVEMRKSPDHWFIALHEITGADPVPINARGIVSEMTRYWLEWGMENGYA